MDLGAFLSKYLFHAVEHLLKVEHGMIVTVIHVMMLHSSLEKRVPSFEAINGSIQ